MSCATWTEDQTVVLSYHDMVAHIDKKNQGNFIYLAKHLLYIQKEPPDRIQRSEESRYKGVCLENISDIYGYGSEPVGDVYIIRFLGKSYSAFAYIRCKYGQNISDHIDGAERLHRLGHRH